MTRAPATPLDEARKLLLAAAARASPAIEIVRVIDAHGRFLARDYKSVINLPQTDNAAVDGYAVDSDFLHKKPCHQFEIIGVGRAGHAFEGRVKPGQALQIFTGSIVPEGPDCVVMHEDCQVTGDHVICGKPISARTNIRSAGENLMKGELIAQKGQVITPADMGQISVAGRSEVAVFKRLNISLLSTGDEVIEAGLKVGKGQIFDSNRPMLAGLIKAAGMESIDGGIIKDQREALTKAYQQALLVSDVVISSGGASDGMEDHTQSAIKDIGAELMFWRLAMKPGRPMAVAQKGQKMIFCLPGNPVAAFVCFKLLVLPVLNKLSGGGDSKPLSIMLPSGFSYKKSSGRAEYLRAYLYSDDQDHQEIRIYGRKGAGVISSLTGATGLVEIPLEAEEIALGQKLRFLPFREQAL